MLHIACAADEPYVSHSAAMLHSVLVSNDASTLHFHYLHPVGLAPDDVAKLRRLVADRGARITFYAIPEKAVADLPTAGRIPRAMWYRIFLPELVPFANQILYLDVDTLVLESLQPLATV